MKKFLKVLGIVLGSIVLLIGAAALFIHLRGIPEYDPPMLKVNVISTPERVERGAKLASILCAECHMDSRTGKLTGIHLAEAPPEFGTIYSRNITQDKTHGIGDWSDAAIVGLLRTGITREGRFIPMMGGYSMMSDEDVHSIFAWLRSSDPRVAASAVPDRQSDWSFLAKVLGHFVFLPKDLPNGPITTPDINDKVAHGKYLATAVVGCYTCHSADFKTMNTDEPEKSERFFGGGNEMRDLDGRVIRTSNITPDVATGIGSWTEAQFIRAMRDGFRPDNTPIRYPMGRFNHFSDQELSTIYAYMKTVPAIAFNVPRDDRFASMRASASHASKDGKAIFTKYACYACHGEDGKGNCDLRDAHKKYGSDSMLVAWIRNPSSIQADTKMPTWEGVIAEDEYAPLAKYVRDLGMRKETIVATK
ncbi:MAG: c-type cytochrome [bacterium]|nr:c-type cytochrome [Candidatus Kapabacteria bacterium]